MKPRERIVIVEGLEVDGGSDMILREREGGDGWRGCGAARGEYEMAVAAQEVIYLPPESRA